MPMHRGWSTPPEYDEDRGWSCCGAKGGHRRDCPLWEPGEPVGEGGWAREGEASPASASRPPLPGAGRPDPWRSYVPGSSSSLGDDPRFRGNYWSADELRAWYEGSERSASRDRASDAPSLAANLLGVLLALAGLAVSVLVGVMVLRAVF